MCSMPAQDGIMQSCSFSAFHCAAFPALNYTRGLWRETSEYLTRSNRPRGVIFGRFQTPPGTLGPASGGLLGALAGHTMHLLPQPTEENARTALLRLYLPGLSCDTPGSTQERQRPPGNFKQTPRNQKTLSQNFEQLTRAVCTLGRASSGFPHINSIQRASIISAVLHG